MRNKMEEIKKLIRKYMRREYARGKYMAYLKVMNYVNDVRFMMVDDAPGCHECISELAERIDAMRAEALKELEEIRK